MEMIVLAPNEIAAVAFQKFEMLGVSILVNRRANASRRRGERRRVRQARNVDQRSVRSENRRQCPDRRRAPVIRAALEVMSLG